MATFILERTTKINAPIDEVWKFFSNPGNLKRITPPSMQLSTITNDLPDEIYADMLIAYTVSPILGVRLNWVTRITDVHKPFYFADEQEAGPYTYWRHEHRFVENGKQTLMNDNVKYKMPFGSIGSIAHGWMVKNKLKQTFDYRTRIITIIFPGSEAL